MPAKKKGDKGGGGGGGRTGRKGDKGGGGGGRPTGGKRDKVYDISNLSIHSGSDARSPSVTIKVINNPTSEYLGQTLLECFYDPIKKEVLRRFLWSISPQSMRNGWEVPRQETAASLGFAFPLGSCFSHRVIVDPEQPLPVLSEPAATPD